MLDQRQGIALGVAAVLLATVPARAQSTIVIVTGEQATAPVPTLMEGPANSLANAEISNHLFLHLANLGPELITSGDKSFVPMLAKSWTRRDSVTLVFDLDERAKWQDGVPVTSQDVVFTFERARDPHLSPRLVRGAQSHRIRHRGWRPARGLPVLSSLR